jgi:arylsulfatase A-like enzyme
MPEPSRRDFLKAAAALSGSLALTHPPTLRADARPNILLIVADDLGYGDLSCYGQSRFPTPHLDRLAAEGMRFTQHYSGSTVCAPSRCTLMAGQHTGHCHIRGNKSHPPEGQEPLPKDAVTVARLLQRAGYRTGAFGKWGLGSPGSSGDPNRQGFNEFFGYICQSLAHNYYPWYLWHNQNRVELPENAGDGRGTFAPDLIQQQALAFLENNRARPFFMFVPIIIPHAELFAPQAYFDRFRGKFLPEKSYQGTDAGPRFKLGGYGSQPEAHAAFAAMVTYLDDKAGELMAKLQQLGLDENTLVLFSSDNGPHLEGGADPDYFDSNGPLRGYKRDLYEGGVRVPLLARWSGHITPGQISTHICAFWDFLPTACEVAGIKKPGNLDGLSYLPALLGKKQKKHKYLYWEFHEGSSTSQAVRMNNWKGVRSSSTSPVELYDLATDVGETEDIAARHPHIARELVHIMKQARTESNVWPFKP